MEGVCTPPVMAALMTIFRCFFGMMKTSRSLYVAEQPERFGRADLAERHIRF